MKRYLTSSFLPALVIFLIGCDETATQTIYDGLQAGFTTILTALITALYEVLSTQWV